MLSKVNPLISAMAIALIVCAFSISHVYAGHHGNGKGKMEMMDSDGDGSISKDEFMSHKEQHFNKKDANGDGMLSEDEITKHCKHHKEKAAKEE